MITNNMSDVLPKMRTSMMTLSLFAFLVSVTYTIKFNVGQATGLDDKMLSGATGFLQDATEVGFALFGAAIISDWTKQAKVMRFIALLCITLSLSLILWSITSTWGANSAMIDGATASAGFEKKKLSLIEDSMRLNSDAARGMEENAAMIREKASAYSAKYTSRAIDKIQEAQAVSERAGQLANRNLSALDELNKIDRELVGNVNSANAAFDRLSQFFNTDRNTVGTTFLLTRATQLELIGILAAIFVIFIPAAPKKQKQKPLQKKVKPDTETAPRANAEPLQETKPQPVQTSKNGPIQGTAMATAPTNAVSTKPQNIGSITETLADSKPLSVPPPHFNGIGFNAVQNRPASVPVQKESVTESKPDTEVYAQFIAEAKAGKFKGDKSDFTSILTKKWIKDKTGRSLGKSQELAKEWLDKAGNAGEFSHNEKWTDGSRANKWSIK